jgi:hypothetical protein
LHFIQVAVPPSPLFRADRRTALLYYPDLPLLYHLQHILCSRAIERQPGNESCVSLSEPTPTPSSRLRPRHFSLGRDSIGSRSCPSRVCTVALPNPAGVSRPSQPAQRSAAHQQTLAAVPRQDKTRAERRSADIHTTHRQAAHRQRRPHTHEQLPALSPLHASRKESPPPFSHPRVVGLLVQVRPSAPERQQDRVTFGEKRPGTTPPPEPGPTPLTLP